MRTNCGRRAGEYTGMVSYGHVFTEVICRLSKKQRRTSTVHPEKRIKKELSGRILRCGFHSSSCGEKPLRLCGDVRLLLLLLLDAFDRRSSCTFLYSAVMQKRGQELLSTRSKISWYAGWISVRAVTHSSRVGLSPVRSPSHCLTPSRIVSRFRADRLTSSGAPATRYCSDTQEAKESVRLLSSQRHIRAWAANSPCGTGFESSTGRSGPGLARSASCAGRTGQCRDKSTGT